MVRSRSVEPVRRLAARRLVVIFLSAAGLILASPTPRAANILVEPLLDRYAAGDLDSAVQEAVGTGTAWIKPLREALAREAPAWAAKDGPDHFARRRLIAATFTLDVARAVYTRYQQAHGLSPQQGLGHTPAEPEFLAGWSQLRSLVEWACGWLRQTPARDPLERLWFQASVELFRDFFDPDVRAGMFSPISDDSAAPGHLGHARKRFPDDPWLNLVVAERSARAEGALRNPQLATSIDMAYHNTKGRPPLPVGNNYLWPLLTMWTALTRLEDAVTVRAEVNLHLGCIAAICGEHDVARTYLDNIDAWTANPCVQYLGHFVRGRLDDEDGWWKAAEESYQAALRVLPDADSGLTALSTLLALDGRPEEATQMANQALAVPSAALDPWLELMTGTGCTRWPEFITALHDGLREP